MVKVVFRVTRVLTIRRNRYVTDKIMAKKWELNISCVFKLLRICKQLAMQHAISFRQHHDIFSLAVAKAHHIAVPQLDVSTTSNLLAVQPRSVRAVQVDEIWFDLAYLVAVLVRLCDVSELHNSVLLADARVF